MQATQILPGAAMTLDAHIANIWLTTNTPNWHKQVHLQLANRPVSRYHYSSSTVGDIAIPCDSHSHDTLHKEVVC